MTRSNDNDGNVGRHDLARVPEPAAGYSPLPSSRQNTRASIAIVAVPDVYEDPRAGYVQRRVRALARIDLLDRERREKKITEAAYQVGREIEAMFERMARISGGGQWTEGDRLDPATQAEVFALLGFEGALKVNAFLAWLVKYVGTYDTRLLWLVLGDRMTLAATAVALGHQGRRGYRYTMDRFRDALATMAEAKAAKGREVRALSRR